VEDQRQTFTKSTNISAKLMKLYNHHQHEEMSQLILEWVLNNCLLPYVKSHTLKLRWTALVITNFKAIQSNNIMRSMFPTANSVASGSANSSVTEDRAAELYTVHSKPFYPSPSKSKRLSAKNNDQAQAHEDTEPFIIPSDHHKAFMDFVHKFNRDYYFHWNTLSQRKRHELYEYYCQKHQVINTLKPAAAVELAATKPSSYPGNDKSLTAAAHAVCTASGNQTTTQHLDINEDEFFAVKHDDPYASSSTSASAADAFRPDVPTGNHLGKRSIREFFDI